MNWFEGTVDHAWIIILQKPQRKQVGVVETAADAVDMRADRVFQNAKLRRDLFHAESRPEAFEHNRLFFRKHVGDLVTVRLQMAGCRFQQLIEGFRDGNTADIRKSFLSCENLDFQTKPWPAATIRISSMRGA
mgnify:CR=1 FL=1